MHRFALPNLIILTVRSIKKRTEKRKIGAISLQDASYAKKLL